MRKACGSRKKIEEEINKIILSIIGNGKQAKNTPKHKKPAKTLDNILERSKERIKEFKEFVPSESYYLFLQQKDENKEKISLKYSIEEEGFSYSVDVDYRSDGKEEETEIKVSVKDEVEKEIAKYSVSISKEESGYTVLMKYKDKDASLKASYKVPIKPYHEAREEKLQDFTSAVDKSLEILPPSIMGGVLGFTYLGENYMARRSDLVGRMALMVDVHEAIHTPDEYETRVLTSWMLTITATAYKK